MPLPLWLGRGLRSGLGLGHELDCLVDRGDGVQARRGRGRQQDEGVGRVLLPQGVGFGRRLEKRGRW